jgi:tetratricopeptide (TPR) repeat protein
MSTDAALPFEQLAARSKRSAWISFLGLIIVLASLGYGAYQLAQLTSEVRARTAELKAIQTDITQAKRELAARSEEVAAIRKELNTTQAQLAASREAVALVTQGINRYHQGSYRGAIDSYNQALRLDPKNPYIANLKGYSEFKANRFDDSIASLKHAVTIDSTYAWGYFDLARVLCADKKFSEAKVAADKAVALRPELANAMASDGEFTRLCRPILKPTK